MLDPVATALIFAVLALGLLSCVLAAVVRPARRRPSRYVHLAARRADRTWHYRAAPVRLELGARTCPTCGKARS